ncbi:Dihydroorotase [Pseudomonas amygdali pv. myricae]|nr:Dihydroorotase [Pseudomonas amygdali pv. myricae]RMU98033.1 Dihydroorotase [Pseudomonas amygdali pv. myricae]
MPGHPRDRAENPAAGRRRTIWGEGLHRPQRRFEGRGRGHHAAPATRTHDRWTAAQRRRVLPSVRPDYRAPCGREAGCDCHAPRPDQPRRGDRIGSGRRRAFGDSQPSDLRHRNPHGGAVHGHERAKRTTSIRTGERPVKLSILGARVIDPVSGMDQVTDLHVEAGKLTAIGAAPEGFEPTQTIDAAGLVAAPGLVDLNVSLREPGYSRKGSIASETRAAVAGGVTSLCCPPQTKPVLDTSAVAELILDRAREAGFSKVFPVGALSKGLEGEQLAELIALRDAGCVAFGNGLSSFNNTRTLCRALEYAATFDLTVIFNSQDRDLAEGGLAHDGATAAFLGLAGIPETAETVALARDLLLVEQSGVHAHFSQLTSARGAALIAQAQARGLPVTADVALYQLILTDEALIDFSSLYHVQPPLRTRADRDGLCEAVKSGVIQAISSHHQPHERDAKLAPFGATEPGISSVELLLPLAMTLVDDGLLDLPTLIARLSSGPAAALRLPAGKLSAGAPADIVLFDPAASTVAGETWLSKGENCPFIGHCLPGSVRYTLVDGRISYSR